MRILVINPALLRLNSLGADEQDRLACVERLRVLDHVDGVHLLTGIMPYQTRADVEAFYITRGLHPDQFTLIDVPAPRFDSARIQAMLRSPAALDGMAWEYGQPAVIRCVDDAIRTYQPSLVWCHGSYLAFAAAQAKSRGLPVVIRSVNYEPLQLFAENDTSLISRVKHIAKQRVEKLAVQTGILAAITPDEKAIYQRLAPSARVKLLPLQSLPAVLRSARKAYIRTPIKLFFMGASYNVAHNRAAVRFIVEQVIPGLRQAAAGEFETHILGAKVPDDLRAFAAADVIFPGYVPDLDAYLEDMDIALVPWIAGVGMQQKVFEPLCRAFPTVTHPRALAGYAFTSGDHVLTADDAVGYVDHLLALCEPALRERLSARAAEQAAALFSPAALDAHVRDILTTATQHHP